MLLLNTCLFGWIYQVLSSGHLETKTWLHPKGSTETIISDIGSESGKGKVIKEGLHLGEMLTWIQWDFGDLCSI